LLHHELYLGEANENLQTLPGTPVSAVTGLVVMGKEVVPEALFSQKFT
jgi:hypothetical protein